MNENPAKLEELLSRFSELESVLMHIQHDVEQLNEAILHQNKIVETLSKSMKQLDSRIGNLEIDDDTQDSYDEKPPHY